MTKVDFYRPAIGEDIKIVTVCMDYEDGVWKSRHIKANEITRNDYMIVMETRIDIKQIDFIEGSVWVRVE